MYFLMKYVSYTSRHNKNELHKTILYKRSILLCAQSINRHSYDMNKNELKERHWTPD